MEERTKRKKGIIKKPKEKIKFSLGRPEAKFQTSGKGLAPPSPEERKEMYENAKKPQIRGINSQRRIDMLKQPKFRR